jgi:outer membrane protease
MRHADALSRSVHWIEKDVNLSRDVIKEEQDKNSLCLKYKHYENFWTDEDGCYIIKRVKDKLAFLFQRL